MSFRLRLIITISLLIAIAFGIGGTALITVSFQTSLEEEMTKALEAFETVQNTLYLLNSLNNQSNYTSLADALSQISEQGIARWQALCLRMDSQVIYQSGSSHGFSAQLPIPEEGECVYTTVRDENLGYGLQVLSTLTAGEERLILEARFVLNSYRLRDSQQQLYLTIYCVVVFGICTASVLAFSMTRRLNQLTATVRKIAGGTLSTRSGIHSKDEFGHLSRDINIMAERLQENIGKLETQMQRQEAFMGAFAHELKTPMTSIIGYADLLRQDGLDNTTRMIAANYIFSEGQRLEKLSFKLLDLLMLKKDVPVMREVSLSTLLLEVEQALNPVLRDKGIRFICRGERSKAALEPDLVKSLLYNLVDNATKAMEPGTDGIIAVKGTTIPGGCRFQVVDNGRGMEKTELTKITEAFYRVDKARSRKQGGAGLGLALCKEIVELHQGNMQFLSAPGTGTRVTVTLYGRAEDSRE